MGCTPEGSAIAFGIVAVMVGQATVVLKVAVLFAKLGSFVVLATVAVLVTVVPPVTPAPKCVTKVKVAVAPLAKEGIVAVTVPAAPTAGLVGVQPAGADRDWNVNPEGRTSVRVTLCAASGPLLVTVIV